MPEASETPAEPLTVDFLPGDWTVPMPAANEVSPKLWAQ